MAYYTVTHQRLVISEKDIKFGRWGNEISSKKPPVLQLVRSPQSTICWENLNNSNTEPSNVKRHLENKVSLQKSAEPEPEAAK